MQIRQEVLRQITDAPSWQDCLKTARDHARLMEFEEGVSCCLEYLHSTIATSPPAIAQAKTFIGLEVVYVCGGNASRWHNFLGIPKQMVDTGESVPLVQRTINQFQARVAGARFSVLIKEEDHPYFHGIQHAETVYRQESSDRAVGIEMLTHASTHIPASHDVLFVYGDVHFSESAISSILDSICSENRLPRYFGRKRKNDAYGNTGGEIFAVFVPAGIHEDLLSYYTFIDRLYIGTPIHRCSSWEVVSLLSAMLRKNLNILQQPQLLESSVATTYSEIKNTLHARDFDARTWVEIDDETEDFDFPCEYIERVYRMVEWVGRALDTYEAQGD